MAPSRDPVPVITFDRMALIVSRNKKSMTKAKEAHHDKKMGAAVDCSPQKVSHVMPCSV